jgi:multidrug efflux pump
VKGQNQDQQESEDFLGNAFGVALFIMAIILVTQFNSFYQAFLILSAVLFSTVGVFLGLIIIQKPFGIVMSGIGVISLAGIVVNNNIVLIDTYNVLRRQGYAVREAILRTGAQRLRPVFLTTVTTILGLMPMVLEVNIDFFNRHMDFGSPSTQWWSQLASAVAGGLLFATLLTLVLTPCLLVLRDGRKEKIAQNIAESTDTPALESAAA